MKNVHQLGALVLIGTLLLGFVHKATGDIPQGCFDFSKKVVEPLHPPLPILDGKDNTALGQLPQEIDWGAARGTVDASVNTLYQKLLDHTIWKSPDNNELEIKEIKKPGYLAFHTVKDTINPIPFVHISWMEEWAYALIRGTPSSVKKMVISYQKTSGTSHLQHLCGSVLLQPASNGKGTDIYLYEEAKADHRDAEDIVKSHLGTLRTLRKAVASQPRLGEIDKKELRR